MASPERTGSLRTSPLFGRRRRVNTGETFAPPTSSRDRPRRSQTFGRSSGGKRSAAVPSASSSAWTGSDLIAAAQAGDDAKVAAIVSFAASQRDLDLLNTRDKTGRTAVIIAAKAGFAQVLNALADAGADLSATVPHTGKAAIHVAATAGFASIVSTLLESKRVDPNATTTVGETALHIAAKSGRAPLAALLLSHGADASLADGNGETPEMLARRGGHSSVLNELAKSAIGSFASGVSGVGGTMVADDPGSFAFSAYDDGGDGGGTMVADDFDNQTVGSTYDDDGGTMVAEQSSAGGRYDGGTMVVDTPYVSTAVGDVTAPDPLQVAHNRIATLERQLAERDAEIARLRAALAASGRLVGTTATPASQEPVSRESVAVSTEAEAVQAEVLAAQRGSLQSADKRIETSPQRLAFGAVAAAAAAKAVGRDAASPAENEADDGEEFHSAMADSFGASTSGGASGATAGPALKPPVSAAPAPPPQPEPPVVAPVAKTSPAKAGKKKPPVPTINANTRSRAAGGPGSGSTVDILPSPVAGQAPSSHLAALASGRAKLRNLASSARPPAPALRPAKNDLGASLGARVGMIRPDLLPGGGGGRSTVAGGSFGEGDDDEWNTAVASGLWDGGLGIGGGGAVGAGVINTRESRFDALTASRRQGKASDEAMASTAASGGPLPAAPPVGINIASAMGARRQVLGRDSEVVDDDDDW